MEIIRKTKYMYKILGF